MFSASLQVALEELDKVRGVQKGDVSSLREAIAAAQPTSAAENRHKIQAHMAKQPLMAQISTYDAAELEAAHLSKQPAASETSPFIYPQAPTGGSRSLRYHISQDSQPPASRVRSGMCQQQASTAAMAESTDPCDPAAMELSDPQPGHREAPHRVLRTHGKQALEGIPGIIPPQEASDKPDHDRSDRQPGHCEAPQQGPRTYEEQGSEETSGIGPAREDSRDTIMQASAAVAAMSNLTGSHPTRMAKRTSSLAPAGMPEQLAVSHPGLCALAKASHLIQAPAAVQQNSGAKESPSQKQLATSEHGLCDHETYVREALALSAVEESGGLRITVSAALAALDSLTGDLNPSIAKSCPLPVDKAIPKETGEAQDGLCPPKDKQADSETEIKDAYPTKKSAQDLRCNETLGGPGARAERAFLAGKGKSKPPYAQGIQHRQPTQAERCAHRDEQLQEEAELSVSCPMAIAAPKLNHKATTGSQWDEKEPQRPGKGKSSPPYPQRFCKGHRAEVQGRLGAQHQTIPQVVPSIGASAEARAATAAAPGTKAPGKDKIGPPPPRAVSSLQRPGALARVRFRKRICRAPCPKAVPGKQQGAAQGRPRIQKHRTILSPATAKGAATAAAKRMMQSQKKQRDMTSDSTADTAAGETSSAIAAKVRLQKWKERQGLMRGTVTCPSAPSGTAAPAATRAFASAPAAANKGPIGRKKSQDRHHHPATATGSAAPAAAQACAAAPTSATADKMPVGRNMSQDRPPYAEALLAVPRTLGQKDKHSNEASSRPLKRCTMAYLDV